MTLKEKTFQLFKQHFDTAPTHFFRAPGRVNLIGEHTDYNDGFVLPCAINYETVIAASPRSDRQISVVAADFGPQTSGFDLAAEITHDPAAPWSNYVRGVAWALQQRGHALGGANLVIAGNVPKGAGLSSSASLEVAVGLALTRLSGLDVDLKTLALTGQQAENDFVGMRCGIMDQFIAALGQADHALLIDCRSLDERAVPIPPGVAVIIANSNVKRGLVDSEYNTRRRECEAAAAHFGVPALRDVSPDVFALHADELDDTVAKRARHVITENARTEAAAEALAQGDLKRMGQLMAESHVSMRDDFEITVPPIDALVEIIGEVIGEAGGVRMTGGGFGGCVVALAPQELAPAVEAAIAQKYPAASGLEATVYICQASAGAGEL
ncbi:MAG: galactokinase [Anaerolineae bacterium]|nr:galactokinase [Anaerolineales bacterium]MCQ3972141.1 galactokinase [Anaerolineae bacterium]